MPKHNLTIAIAAILGAGLLFLVSNLQLPIVRNSFVYAKAATNVIERGFNPLPVIADPALSHSKPIAFSLLSLPFVWLLDANAGVKVASFVGTGFLLCVAYFVFARLNRRVGIDPRFLPLELTLLFFNPLSFYQFWSGYPDSLFAGLVLLAFVLVDIIVVEHDRDTRPHIILLGLVIYTAILTKLYGMILGIACPAYVLLHGRAFLRRSSYLRSKIVLLVLLFGVLGAAVVLTYLGRNPTLEFAPDDPLGGGYSEYVAALTNPSGAELIPSAALVTLALVLNFHVSLFFLLRSGRRAWVQAPMWFAGLYFLGLLPVAGSSYNMRYFLPVFPFVVIVLVSGFVRTRRWVGRGMLVAYAAAASVLTVNYNVGWFYERVLSLNETVAEAVAIAPNWMDNLRLGQHLALSKKIDRINETIEPGGVLYWVSSYYGTATHGLAYELGVRNDIVVHYVSTAAEIPATEPVSVTGYWSGGVPSGVRDRFAARPVGLGVFRLTPLRVELISPLGEHLNQGAPILLVARASASTNTRVRRAEFLIDGRTIAVDEDPPFQFAWHGAGEGRHVATATVQDSEGNRAVSAPMTIFVGTPALERSITRSGDDAEELPSGRMYLTSSDLELTEDPDRGHQVVGLRFTDVRVPRGAQISKAYLQFTADEVSSGRAEIVIQAELAADAQPFQQSDRDISSRPRTRASVRWSPQPWTIKEEAAAQQRTPDLSALVTEVVALPGWREGNALSFVISGSGYRSAASYEGNASHAPILYIEPAKR